MCGLIHADTLATGTLVHGMNRAFSTFPSEIVGLALDLDDPEAIGLARINMPMMIGRIPGAVFLATTAMAFPDGVNAWIVSAPANAAMRVTANDSFLMPLDPNPAPVTNVLPWHEAETAIRKVLDDGKPHPFGHLSKAVEPFFPIDDLHPKAMLVYEILRKLHHQKHIAIVNRTVPGAANDVTAPQLRANLI
jgi:hypothetical protein